MVGDDEATAAFTDYWLSRRAMAPGNAEDADDGSPSSSSLCYSTGRTLEQYLDLKGANAFLCEPDFLICAVGTRVYERDGEDGEWVEVGGWAAQLGDGWCTDAARESAEGLISLFGESRVHMRPPHEQNAHKVTCGVRSEIVDECCASVNQALTRSQVKAKLVYSGSGDWKYLDILPARGGKLESLDFLRQRLGFSRANTITAGDSGNDIAMMEGDHCSIIVGNAQSDLTDWYAQRGAPNVVKAESSHARGILEGLHSFNLY